MLYLKLLIVFLLLFIASDMFVKHMKRKLIDTELEEFCEERNYLFMKTKGPSDFVIESETFKIIGRICKIPPNSSVTINSRSTWVLRYGGKKKGRNYPHRRYLNELTPFLNLQFDPSGKQLYKLVIFYPGTEIILRCINESELIEVKPENVNFGFKAVTYDAFRRDFDRLLVNCKKDLNNPYNK